MFFFFCCTVSQSLSTINENGNKVAESDTVKPVKDSVIDDESIKHSDVTMKNSETPIVNGVESVINNDFNEDLLLNDNADNDSISDSLKLSDIDEDKLLEDIPLIDIDCKDKSVIDNIVAAENAEVPEKIKELAAPLSDDVKGMCFFFIVIFKIILFEDIC